MNRPVQINNPLNYVATYGYNKAGLLESVGGTKNANDVLDLERETVSLSDDQDKFLISETKTVENGSTITTPVSTIRYQYTNHLGSASLELDHTASIIRYEEYHPFGTTSYRSGRTETENAFNKKGQLNEGFYTAKYGTNRGSPTLNLMPCLKKQTII